MFYFIDFLKSFISDVVPPWPASSPQFSVMSTLFPPFSLSIYMSISTLKLRVLESMNTFLSSRFQMNNSANILPRNS